MTVAALNGEWGRQIADLLDDLVCVCEDSSITWINAAGARLLAGPDPDAGAARLKGMPFGEVVHVDYREIVELGLDVLADEGGALPLLMTRLDGRVVEVELRVRRAEARDGAPAMLVHGRDITERARAVAELMESEHRYRNLVEMSLNLIFVVQHCRPVVVNAAARALLGGTTPDQLTEIPFADLVHPDYRDVIDLGLEELAGEVGVLPLKMMGLDDRTHDVEVRVIRFGAQAFMIEGRDISDRMRSAEALREREARLQGVLDTVAEGIVTADERGIIQSFNPAAERLFGWSRDQAIGRNLSMLMPSSYAAYHDSHMSNYRAGRQGWAFGKPRELQGMHKNGQVFPIELSLAEMRLGHSRLYTGVIRDITQRKRAEEALKRYNVELEQRVGERTAELRILSRQNESILESAGDGIVALDMDGVISLANPAAEQMLGFRRSGMAGLNAATVFRYGEEGRRGRPVPVRAALRRGVFHERTEVMLMRLDRSSFHAEYASAPIEDDGRMTGAVVIFRDITDRRRTEERLRVAATVFDTTAEGIAVCASDGTVTTVNPAFAAIIRIPVERLVGSPLSEALGCNAEEEAAMLESLTGRGAWEGEKWSRRGDGSDFAARIACSAVPERGGSGTAQFVAVVNDITERKKAEDKIRYQASYDALTGLPNRALFLDRLEQAVIKGKRARHMVGLMFIDLDGFKAVNDTLGHEAGDQLLQGAGKRLLDCVRESDTVARLGGDEFTVIMDNVDGRRGAAIVAQRIIDSLEVPFDLNGRQGNISASIGIAILPEDAADSEDLLRNADTAMYAAKNQGKANFQFFTATVPADPASADGA